MLLGETVSALSECLAPPYEWLFENYQPDMQGVTCYGLAFHPGRGGGGGGGKQYYCLFCFLSQVPGR